MHKIISNQIYIIEMQKKHANNVVYQIKVKVVHVHEMTREYITKYFDKSQFDILVAPTHNLCINDGKLSTFNRL